MYKDMFTFKPGQEKLWKIWEILGNTQNKGDNSRFDSSIFEDDRSEKMNEKKGGVERFPAGAIDQTPNTSKQLTTSLLSFSSESISRLRAN